MCLPPSLRNGTTAALYTPFPCTLPQLHDIPPLQRELLPCLVLLIFFLVPLCVYVS